MSVQPSTPARRGLAQGLWRMVALLVACSLLAVARADPYEVAPLPPGRGVDAGYFGAHVHNLVLRGRTQDPPQATPFPAGLVGALRLWDTATRWAEVQPAPDRWAFDRLDRYIDVATAQGARVVLTLGSTPRWASARPDEPCSYGFGCSAEPADMADWDRYVQTLARRYKGRIAWYEVWNEPHPSQVFEGHRGFYAGSMAALIEMARRAHEVLQREDPAARLLSPGFVNRLPVLEAYMAQGGARYAQGVAYHFYAGSDRQVIDQVRAVRQTMARHGLADLPLVNTESSYAWWAPGPGVPQGEKPRTAEVAAALQSHAMVLGAFLGVESWFLHGWDNEDSGAVDRQLQPTPLLPAFRAVRGWLLGLEPRGCRSVSDNVVRCDGRRGAEQVALLWRPQPGPAVAVRLPEALQRAESVEGQPPPLLPDGQVLVGSLPVAVWLGK